MTVELFGDTAERRRPAIDEYCSPETALHRSSLARLTLQEFLASYRAMDDHAVEAARTLGPYTALPPVENEMFTGYGGLGDLVHVRVDPYQQHTKDGYFVARANLHSGEIDEPTIRSVDTYQDSYGQRKTKIYFDDERCQDWPPEYQPMIHFALQGYEFTYRPGFGQGESKLRPIVGLIRELPPMRMLPTARDESLGRRALGLVHSSL